MARLTVGQQFSLLLSARFNSAFPIIDRARALYLLSTPEFDEAAREPLGDLVGQCAALLAELLPPPTSDHFPHAVDDVLRRMRARGYLCSDVFVSRVTGDGDDDEGRLGWRVSWDGDGWECFSRTSPDPIAAQNRRDLEEVARACGLVITPEAAPTLLAVEPQADYFKADFTATSIAIAATLDSQDEPLAPSVSTQFFAEWEAEHEAAYADFLGAFRLAQHRRDMSLALAMVPTAQIMAKFDADVEAARETRRERMVKVEAAIRVKIRRAKAQQDVSHLINAL